MNLWAVTDPNGFVLEMVHGQQVLPALVVEDSLPLNLGAGVECQGEVKRMPSQRPARIKRLGHIGFNVADVPGTCEWYRQHFGLIVSDQVQVGDLGVAYFCRFDRGETYTDHHSVLLAQDFAGGRSLNHMSWEVCDVDNIFLGHERLAEVGYQHNWGIGRHTLGSQIFDYWRDPWGQIHEHFTDGDLLTSEHPAGAHQPDQAESQWGPQIPADFSRPPAKPLE